MSQSQQSPVQADSELTSQLRSVIKSLQKSEPLKADLSADEFDALRGFVETQMLPDGGYPKDGRYRVESKWMDYAPDGGSRIYERRFYYDATETCVYSLGYQGGWRRERCW